MKELLALSMIHEEHTVFHIALKPDGSLQDIMCVPLQFDNSDLLRILLQTDRLGGKIHDVNQSEGYFFMYDGLHIQRQNHLHRHFFCCIICLLILFHGSYIIQQKTEKFE